MSSARKRQIVAAVLALLAVWPLVHRLLVARYDISPWRFFGWAMYCQPAVRLIVDTRVHLDGRELELADALADSSELMRQRFEFAERRQIWGELLPPDDLARRILDAVPRAQAVEVVVRRLVLDPSTADLRARTSRYSYAR